MPTETRLTKVGEELKVRRTASVLNLLVKDCREHEHRGCKCQPKDSEGCWGNLANKIAESLILSEPDLRIRKETTASSFKSGELLIKNKAKCIEYLPLVVEV